MLNATLHRRVRFRNFLTELKVRKESGKRRRKRKKKEKEKEE